MPRYKVTNRQTGETTIIERASPPTPGDEQELQAAFAKPSFTPPASAESGPSPLVAQANPLVQQFDLSPTQTATSPAPAPNAAVSAPIAMQPGTTSSPLQVVGDAASYWSRSPLVRDVGDAVSSHIGRLARGARMLADAGNFIPGKIAQAARFVAGRYGPAAMDYVAEPFRQAAGVRQQAIDFAADQAYQHVAAPAGRFFSNYVMPPEQAPEESSSPALPMPERAAPPMLTNGRGVNPIYLNAPRDPAQREAGTVYLTPAGPMQWTAKGWLKLTSNLPD